MQKKHNYVKLANELFQSAKGNKDTPYHAQCVFIALKRISQREELNPEEGRIVWDKLWNLMAEEESAKNKDPIENGPTKILVQK